jgi:hypothetical protein
LPGTQLAVDIANCYSTTFDQILNLPNIRTIWPVTLAYINAKMAYAATLRSKGHLKSHIERFDCNEYNMQVSEFVLEQTLEGRNNSSSSGASTLRASGSSGRSFQAGNSTRSSKKSLIPSHLLSVKAYYVSTAYPGFVQCQS